MSARDWLRGRARLVRGLLLVLAASTGEWFELRRATDGSLVIAWRGITPPAGVCQTYGGIAGGACNTCHQSASANDFVQTPSLALSAIAP